MTKLKKLFDSDIYIVLIFALNVLFWTLKLQIWMMGISSLLAIFIILADIKRSKIITLILANIINYRSIMLEDNAKIMIVAAIILGPLAIFDLFKHKISLKHPIAIALLIFLGVNILSLVNTTKDNFYLGIIGVGQIFLYTFIFVYFDNKKEGNEYSFLAKNAANMGIAIAMQMIIHFLRFYLLGQGAIDKGNINLGWGISNFIAVTVCVLIPPTAYLYIENQKRKHIIFIVVLELGVIFLTFSKGAFLALGIAFIPYLLSGFHCAPSKKVLAFDLFIALIFSIIGLLIISQVETLWNGFLEYFEDMGERGWFKDEGRLKIYRLGIEQFKLHPLLGSGSYTGQYYIGTNINYHNYIVQTLATLGILGLLSFTYLVYAIIKGSLVKHFFNLSMLFVIILMSIHGLVDTTWYNPLIMVILFMFLPFLKTKVNPD